MLGIQDTYVRDFTRGAKTPAKITFGFIIITIILLVVISSKTGKSELRDVAMLIIAAYAMYAAVVLGITASLVSGFYSAGGMSHVIFGIFSVAFAGQTIARIV